MSCGLGSPDSANGAHWAILSARRRLKRFADVIHKNGRLARGAVQKLAPLRPALPLLL